MSPHEANREIDPRLVDLYQRHRDAPMSEGIRFYEPGEGYRVGAANAREEFAIALVSVDGEQASVGDD